MLMPRDNPLAVARAEHGFTLVEVLVAMVLGLIVSFAAFSALEFTTRDVSHITDRVHVDQGGRIALEQIMLMLHSDCVAADANVIEIPSTSTELRFLSETSPFNGNKEPTSELPTVQLHDIYYTAGTKPQEGTLREKSWVSHGTPPNYTFTTTEKPTERLLLKGVEPSGTKAIFRYFRYWQSGESGAKLGELDPNEVTLGTSGKAAEVEAEKIAKVTVTFTVAPEGNESSTFGHDRPIQLEDSATFRLATASEAAGNGNLACTQTT